MVSLAWLDFLPDSSSTFFAITGPSMIKCIRSISSGNGVFKVRLCRLELEARVNPVKTRWFNVTRRDVLQLYTDLAR